MKVKASLPPKNGKGWTVLLECGHTRYDVASKKRPKNVDCALCRSKP
jgi:hypothetical protein